MSDLTDFKKGAFICFEYFDDYYEGKVIKNLKHKMMIEVTRYNRHKVYADEKCNNRLTYVITNSDRSIELRSIERQYEKIHMKAREEKDCIDYDDMMEKHYLEWEEQIQDNNLTCCQVFCKSWWRYDIEKWNNPVCINCCKWLIEDNIKFKKIEVKLIDGEPRKKRVIKKKI